MLCDFFNCLLFVYKYIVIYLYDFSVIESCIVVVCWFGNKNCDVGIFLFNIN